MDYRYFTSKKNISIKLEISFTAGVVKLIVGNVWVQCQMPNALIFWKMFLV